MLFAKTKRDKSVFYSSVFFVLGISTVFSILGILLQTVLAHASAAVEVWLGRLGGVIIILFGLFLLGLWTPKFLMRDHKFAVHHRFRSHYATSFVFGAAFAFGWTPCVSAALGAILALATTKATSAFVLLLAYTLGLGMPFLLVGWFTNEAQDFINRAGKWLQYVEYVFGVVLVIIGILVFVGELGKIANLEFLTSFLVYISAGTSIGDGISSLSIINVCLAFIAGLVSFLSPCILPLIPGLLSYLATTSIKKETV